MTDASSWLHGTDKIGGTCVVALAGELDMSCSGAIRQLLLDELAATSVVSVIADLSRVSFIDSTIISALIAAYLRAEETGRQFQVSDPQPRVRDVLDLTGVLGMLMPTS